MLSHVKKISVLHIVDLSKTGGVETMFMAFLPKISKLDQNIKHTVFALRIDPSRSVELSKIGVELYLPKNNKYNIFRRISLLKILLINDYDIIHGQNFSGNFWGAISRFFQLRNKVTLISHEHGSSWMSNGVHLWASKFWASQSKVVICNSNAASIIVKERLCKNTDTRVVYNGVNTPKIKALLKKRDDTFVILFVGRLEDVKGVRELTLALKILKSRNVKYHCNIIGDGKLKNWLVQYIDANGLSDNVTMHGTVDNVAEFMASSNILVLPSLREPLGNVILEAARLSLPVVASKIDGITEIVNHGKTGLLLRPRFEIQRLSLPKRVVNEYGELTSTLTIDPVELANALIYLSNNRSECVQYGVRARENLKDFTIDRYVKKIWEVYLNTLELP